MAYALPSLWTPLLSAATATTKEVKDVTHASTATAAHAFLDGIFAILQESCNVMMQLYISHVKRLEVSRICLLPRA